MSKYPKYSILKVRDKADNFHHKVSDLFDTPFKLLLSSKSQHGMGKTSIIVNLLANPKFPYSKMFKGENIYIISNNELDNKLNALSKALDIPDENRQEFDVNYLDALYDDLEDQFKEAQMEKAPIPNFLIIFDDVGFDGGLANRSVKENIINKLVSNGRHVNISTIFSVQKYSMANTTLRSQLTGAILGKTSAKEVELIADDLNYFKKKAHL
tara:strand:- start:323 stop:958 length:636 start_codon:yes stop_codon:yes gene_type:complete